MNINKKEVLLFILHLRRKVANIILWFIHYFERENKVFEIDKPQPFLIKIYYDIAGNLYYWFQRKREESRIFLFRTTKNLSSLRIINEILGHTKDIIFLLISLTFLSLVYYLFQKFSFEISKGALVNILIAYFGGLTALLGVIFALYSVGFQTNTEKFSSEVVDYLNSEQVGKFLFKMLVFSTLFSLTNLVVQSSTDVVIYPFFFISTPLVVVSILGILVFKDDYVTKLKPKEVFQRLQRENIKAVRRVNAYDSPSLKSFKLYDRAKVVSFKLYLSFLSSWSIIQSSYNHTKKRMDIYETFYRDLIREQKYEDASFGILGLGYFLAEYVSVKHFIETDYAWWFPTYQELVKADKSSIIPIKLNYESQGIGRLGTSKTDFTWLEDKVLKFLNRIQNDKQQLKNPLIANALIGAYEAMLYGSYSETRKGHEKFLFGVFENQDFELAEKIFEQFVQLGHIVNDMEDCRGNYINTFGRVKTVMLDGFSKRHFPGKLEDWTSGFREKIDSFVQDEELLVNHDDIISWKMPQYINKLMLDVFSKLEVEQKVEGMIKTPKIWYVNTTIEVAKMEEKKQVEKQTKLFINASMKLVKDDKSSFYRNYFSGVLLSSFNQLIFNERWEELTAIIKEKGKDIINDLNNIDRKIFLETELRESIDMGVFKSLVERNKIAYWFYLRLFFLAQLHLAMDMDKNNDREVLIVVRRPLMLGSLAYLISELDQDDTYVQRFVRVAEFSYPNISLAEFYENAIDLRKRNALHYMNITYEEANRYRHYYRYIINSILDLPEDVVTSGGIPWGISSTKTVKHPSRFIKRMASFAFSDMEECFEGFVGWLKQREETRKKLLIIKLVNLLSTKYGI